MDWSDVIFMAGAVQSLSVVKDDGEIVFCDTETYARGVIDDPDVAEEALDAALEVLIEEGEVEEQDGTYYMVKDREAWRQRQEEERIDAEQQAIDERQSYHFNIWG